MPFRTRAVVTGAVLATAAVLLCPAAAVARTAAAPAAALPAAPPAPGWSVAPAPGSGARPGAQDRPFFYLEGAPGTVMTDRLSLSNPTGRPVTVRLHGRALGPTGSGALAVRGPDRGSGPGSWIAPATERVEVPARTRASVPFTVTVPREALPGDHPAALVATSGGRDRTVRIHLRVAGPALSALSVEDVSVTRRGSTAVIGYTLVNRGNTVLTPRLAVRADGRLGTELRRAARTLPVDLLPGRRLARTEIWRDPPALDAVDVRLDVTAAGGAQATGAATYTAVPWTAAAGAALALTAGCGWLARRRRRRARQGRGARGSEGGEALAEVVCRERELASTGAGAASGPGSGVRS
ncbi:hypothetical protein QOM21_22095 [Streptomyces sp. Pv4-95]|uniref:COG1470 family protein n=1 Tax=Streptomyces sp. Pv4-95 TaxID=3049543 RepID=UPI0038913705